MERQESLSSTSERENDYEIDFTSIIAQTPAGQIVEGVHKPSGTKVAVRMIIKKWWDEDIEKQVEVEKKTKHPNLIKFYDVLYNPKSNFIIVELAEGGSLRDAISSDETIPLSKIREIGEMLWSVCRYLSKMDAMVEHLCPEAIVLCKDPVNDESIYKVTDVGITRALKKNSNQNFISASIPYRAPELEEKEKSQLKVDLWSIGVILYELFTKKLPFHEGEEPDPKKVDYSGIPNNLSNLIKRLLIRDVTKRLGYNQFMSHPFFDESIEEDEEEKIPTSG